jgi:hypothetical protein
MLRAEMQNIQPHQRLYADWWTSAANILTASVGRAFYTWHRDLGDRTSYSNRAHLSDLVGAHPLYDLR